LNNGLDFDKREELPFVKKRPTKALQKRIFCSAFSMWNLRFHKKIE